MHAPERCDEIVFERDGRGAEKEQSKAKEYERVRSARRVIATQAAIERLQEALA